MHPSVSYHRLPCWSSCIPGHTHEHGKSTSLPWIILRGPPERLKELNSNCCTHDVLALLARAIQASSRDPSRLQLCHFTTRLTDLCQRTITPAISCCVHHHASWTDLAPPVCRAVTMQYSCWQHCYRALLAAHERKFVLGSRSSAQYPQPRCPTDTNTSDFRRQICCVKTYPHTIDRMRLSVASRTT